MIERTMTLTIKDNSATLNGKLIFYLGDCGVRINFVIQDVKYAFNQSNVLGELGGNVKVLGYARKPNGTVFNLNKGEDGVDEQETDSNGHFNDFVDDDNLSADTKNNIVKFKLTRNLTNEMDEVGTYTVQLILQSYEGEEVVGQLTLPPFQFEVRDSLMGV